MKNEVTLTGLDDVEALLRQIAPNEARNLIRATVHDVAVQLAEDAIAGAPMRTGSLRFAIKARRRRGTRNRMESSVEVTGGGKGFPFYWRFLEYGHGPDGVEHAFFLRALQKMRGQLERTFLLAFARKFEARLARLGRSGK